MIAVVIGTVVGSLLSIVAVHYCRLGLRRWTRRKPEGKAKELGRLE